MNWKALAEIKGYMQRVRPYFVEWNIRLVSEWWRVKITYKDYFIDFSIKERLSKDDKEAIVQVIEFCFDCYSDFEWKWEPLKSETLWVLLNLRPWSVRSILSRIYSKLQIYGKPILQEEQKAPNLQDNKQGTTRGRIPKKQSPRDTWKKKKRVEVPLWENPFDCS